MFLSFHTDIIKIWGKCYNFYMSKMPQKLQALLWSSNVDKLNIEKDAALIINKVLAYGDLEDIRWLISNYGKDKVKETFLEKPINIYTKYTLNFLRKFLLNPEEFPIDDSKYVKSLY